VRHTCLGGPSGIFAVIFFIELLTSVSMFECREAMTLDGGEISGGRTGHVITAARFGRSVTLRVYGIEPGTLEGWCLNVLDGSGAGQWARIVSLVAGVDRAEFELDTPLLGLDASSLVQVEPMRGRLIFYRVQLQDAGVWQYYGQAKNVIAAENIFQRTDGFIAIGVNEGTHLAGDPNCSALACNYNTNVQLQYLENQVLESNHVWNRYAEQSQGAAAAA
jgi:hypothetical protein